MNRVGNFLFENKPSVLGVAGPFIPEVDKEQWNNLVQSSIITHGLFFL